VFDEFGFFNFEHAFPLGDDRSGHRVADHVGGGAAHVEELVDRQDERHAFDRQAEHGERAGDHHQRCARDGGNALGTDHQRQQDQDLRATSRSMP
jgi:hypothetical protein